MNLTVFLAIALVWAALFVVPVLVYGAFSAVTGLQPPGGSPLRFLAGTAVSKLGTAVAFVGIFMLAPALIEERWLVYAGLWWLMFVISEIGQAITPTYSREEALAGVISETIYFPLSGLVLVWLL